MSQNNGGGGFGDLGGLNLGGGNGGGGLNGLNFGGGNGGNDGGLGGK